MSTEMISNAKGRQVVGSQSAESIGSVKGFVFDATGRTIEAIHVDGHGKRASVLPWSAVRAFGADAVMASAGADATPIENDHEAAVKGSVTMLGTRVLSVEGREVGTIADVEFDTRSGAVVRVITDQDSIERDRVRSLGSYALIVDALPATQ